MKLRYGSGLHIDLLSGHPELKLGPGIGLFPTDRSHSEPPAAAEEARASEEFETLEEMEADDYGDVVGITVEGLDEDSLTPEHYQTIFTDFDAELTKMTGSEPHDARMKEIRDCADFKRRQRPSSEIVESS